MLLSDHDLLQIDDEYIESLSSLDAVKEVAKRLCHDLKEARDRLNQSPNNSSCPPSSRKPWDVDSLADFQDGGQEDKDSGEDATKSHDDELKASTPPKCGKNNIDRTGTGRKKSPRNPGKQPGSQGFGRTQVLKLTGEVIHKVNTCFACGSAFGEDAKFVACNGHYVIDILWGDSLNPGIRLTNTKHTVGRYPFCHTEKHGRMGLIARKTLCCWNTVTRELLRKIAENWEILSDFARVLSL